MTIISKKNKITKWYLLQTYKEGRYFLRDQCLFYSLSPKIKIIIVRHGDAHRASGGSQVQR